MVTSVENGEPVSPGLFNRLWAFLTRDLSDDRRPKHPRPEIPFGGLQSPQNTGSPRPKPPQPVPPNIDVGKPPRGGSGVLPEPPPDDIDEIHSTGRVGDKTFVPKPPKTPTSEDRVRPRIDGESIKTDLRGGLRENSQGAENALLTATEEKDHAQVPSERGWIKREPEKASETSNALTAIKWIIGVGASIGLGWLLEWAVF
jgi:hypothetical protein